MQAHLSTLLPNLGHVLWPGPTAPFRPWSTELVDAERGRVRLTGELREVQGSDSLTLLVHGLGSSADALHCRRGARRLARMGVSSLCLSLRGADLSGEDFYNVAQGGDLQHVIQSPELRRFSHIDVIGYSMGGYISLHFAAQCADPRVRAVAALCTPLDLGAAQRHIDSLWSWPYRRRVLAGLVAIYREVARRRSVPTPIERVRCVRTVHEWDRLTIAPRYGFDSPEHYYRELSIVPRLSTLRVPALLVASRRDPVVPPHTIEPFLPPPSEAPLLRVAWLADAGHLELPADLNLGPYSSRSPEHHLMGWFRRMGTRSLAGAARSERLQTRELPPVPRVSARRHLVANRTPQHLTTG